MADLRTTLGPIELRNPVVIASSPPTETLEGVIACEEAGAGAVVIKTIADFDAGRYPLGARRTYVDERGLWAMSTFRRETFNLDDGVDLVRAASRRLSIPVIASVGAITMDPSAWVDTCRGVERAGAQMVQLDLFYVPQPRASAANLEALRHLISTLLTEITIPVVPKLNVDIPAYLARDVLRDLGLEAVFAIDSIRVPPPIDFVRGGGPAFAAVVNPGEASLFGQWQKPITLQYARILAERLSVSLCVGGGLDTGYDAAEAIYYGASAAMFATAVIRRGYQAIPKIVRQLDTYLEREGYDSTLSLKDRGARELHRDESEIRFEDVRAEVDMSTCIMCGRCTTQAFCHDITLSGERIEILPACDGCGHCLSVCPTNPNSLRLVPGRPNEPADTVPST